MARPRPRLRRVLHLALVGAVVSAVLLASSCGEDEASSPPTTTETTTPAPPPAPEPPPAPTPPPPPPAAPKPQQIVIVVDRGRPRGGIKRPTLERGSRIVLVVRSDLGEAIHIHGYDVERPLTPGRPLRIPLTVAITGRFEVELHHPDSLLAVLEVRP